MSIWQGVERSNLEDSNLIIKETGSSSNVVSGHRSELVVFEATVFNHSGSHWNSPFCFRCERQGFSKLSSLHSSQVVPFLESNLPYKTDLFLLEAETLRFIWRKKVLHVELQNGAFPGDEIPKRRKDMC